MPKLDCIGVSLKSWFEHDLRHRVALELDHDADAVAVGLVAQVGDPLDVLALHQLGDALDQARLVHLVRQLGDDDRDAVALLLVLDAGARLHLHRAVAGRVGLADPGGAADDRRRSGSRGRAPA